MYAFTLIKRGKIHTGPGKVIPKQDASELISAQDVLKEAYKESEQMHNEAIKHAEEIRKQAKESGFEEGLHLFHEHLCMFEDQIKVLRHEMQKAMLPLVLKSTKKIIGNLLEINPDTVVSIVQESIKGVCNAKVVKLFVNRADIELLEKEKESLKRIFESLDSFSIEERKDVTRGSCIIETERGILNATLENQFRALERAYEAHRTK